MTTIWITKREPGQKVPRPFNRADNAAEMYEMVDHFVAAHKRKHPHSGGIADERRYDHLDTDSPVWTDGKTELFAHWSEF